MPAPRLFADYAAVPTPRERRAARAEHRALQGNLFADATPVVEPPRACPVCAGDHAGDACPHGTAPTLDLDARPDPSDVRAMFAGFGWTVTTP